MLFSFSTCFILLLFTLFTLFTFQPPSRLLVIAKKDLDGQPVVVADLEALRYAVNRLDLVVGQAPAVNVIVGLDALRGDALGDDAPALLDAPDEEHLLDRLALGVCQRLERVVCVQRRVGRAQARVAGAVDALGLGVRDELGRGVARMQLDLVDGGDNLFNVREASRVKKPGTRTLQLGSLSKISRFLTAKLETPMFLTLPVPTSFCISRHVSTKFQSSKTTFSPGITDAGQWIR